MQPFQRTEFGDYVLHDRIGAGGMAEIFLASSRGIEGFEKRLVIKRILPTFSGDKQFVRMFIEEAKLCVSLRHPNIVQVYDLGEIDAQYFIAMEYVDGRDLLKTLAACGKKRIGFPTDIALYIVMEVLKGLDYAHTLKRPDGQPLGIIHRDVSPSNVLLSFDGDVKMADFGIAKASTREKTETGILKGKFGYMAPEQVTGAPIDHRADIFAVGIVLYELLTGHRLFAGKNDLAVLERVRDALIEPPPRHYRPDLASELEAIVLRALARDSRARFQRASELHDALFEYTFRSHAVIGPSQLGRFMQSLFLTDPEELERRARVLLPLPPPLPGEMSSSTQDGLSASAPTGENVPLGDRPNGQMNGQVDVFASASDPSSGPSLSPVGPLPGFNDRTPDLGSSKRVDSGIALSVLASQVVYIAPDEDWERHSAPIPPPIPPPEEDSLRRTHGDETPLISVLSQASFELPEALKSQSTGVEDGAPEATAWDRPPEERSDEAPHLPRELLEQETEASVGRVSSRVDTHVPLDAIEKEPSGRSWAPSEIVERTASSDSAPTPLNDEHDFTETGTTTEDDELSDPDGANDEVEPTLRVDSGVPIESLRRNRPSESGEETGSPEPIESEIVTHEDAESLSPFDEVQPPRGKLLPRGARFDRDKAELGTLEILETELPTSEVSEKELVNAELRARFKRSIDEEDDRSPEVVPLEAAPPEDTANDEDEPTHDVRRLPLSATEPITTPDPSNEPDTSTADDHPFPPGALDPSGHNRFYDSQPYEAVDPRSVREQTDSGAVTDDFNDETDGRGHEKPTKRGTTKGHRRERSEVETRETDPPSQVVAGEAELAETRWRRRPITSIKRPRPVLLPAKDDEPIPAHEMPRRTGLKARRARSVAPSRRRISVINPRDLLDNAAGSQEITGFGQLVDDATDSGELQSTELPVPDAVSLTTPPKRSKSMSADLLSDSGRLASNLPRRRSSSGVNAAVSEAEQIEEEIAEIRRESMRTKPDAFIAGEETPPASEATSQGELADEIESRASIQDAEPILEIEQSLEVEEDGEEGKTDLHQAILRRQQRRRFVTNSVVLFADDESRPMEEDSFGGNGDDSHQLPLITSAGRLQDEGASDLFGALSVLDHGAANFEPDEENSMPTSSEEQPELDAPAAMPRVDRFMIAPSVQMELKEIELQAERAGSPFDPQEISKTGLGSLAGSGDSDDEPSVVEWSGAQEIPQAARIRASVDSVYEEPPDESTASVTDGQVMEVSRLARSQGVSAPSVLAANGAAARQPSSGIEIEFEAMQSSPEDSLSLDDNATAIEDNEGANGHNGNLRDLNDSIQDEVRKIELRLISDSFEINEEASPRRSSPAVPQLEAPPAMAPGPAAPSIKVRSKPEHQPIAPRMARELNRPAREINRPNGQEKAPAPARSAPQPRPTPPQNGIPRPGLTPQAAPSSNQAHTGRTEGRPGMNRALTVVVLLATVLAVAAAVTLLLGRTKPQPVKIPTRAQSPMPVPDPNKRLVGQKEVTVDATRSPPKEVLKDPPKETSKEAPKEAKEAPSESREREIAGREKEHESRDNGEEHASRSKKKSKKGGKKKARAARDKEREKEREREREPKEPAPAREASEAPAQKGSGTIEFACSEPAQVSVNKTVYNDVTKKTLKLAPGPYTVSVLTPQHPKIIRVVNVVEGASIKLPCGG